MNPIYLAIDTPDPVIARQIIDDVRDYIGGVKLGLTFIYACLANPHESTLINTVAGIDWFCDAKLYDIPAQVAGAVRAILPLKPAYITVHIGELTQTTHLDRWREELMMRAAVDAANEESVILGVRRPKLLGVTTLTDRHATPTEIVAKAYRGISCGLDGIVCSPLELPLLRDELGTKPILVTPGIRSDETPVSGDDQLRTATPQEAMAAGADIIVVGRPITQVPDRRLAAKRLLDSLG